MGRIRVIVIVSLFLSLSFSITLMSKYRRELKESKQNNIALLEGVNKMKLKNDKQGIEVNALQLSLNQYKKYRKEQTDSLKKLGIKLKNLEMVAHHYMEINAQLEGQAKDSVIKIIRDSVIVSQPVKYIDVTDRYIELKGIADNKKFTGTIKLPVNITQTVEAQYRRKFLWWRWGLIGFKQKLISDNPYVKPSYSEMVKIK